MIKNFGLTNARLSARIAAVVGGTALSLVSTMSMAAIVDSGVINLAIPATVDGIYLNVVTGATATSSPSPAGWDFNPWVSGGFLTFFSSSAVGNTNQVVGAPAPAGATLLAAGAVIGPASTYAAAGVVSAPAFRVASTTSFVGFQFRNEATAATNYGYAQLTTTAATGSPAVITRYVYENTGLPITIAGGGGTNTAPTLAYTPTTATGVTFPAGPAGAATASIAIVGTGAVGTGNTVVSGCAITGAGAGAFAAPTTTPANGTFNTTTAAGTINLGCTRAAAAASASLACTQTPTPGTASVQTWALTCPAATLPAVVTPTTASGTPSPLPSYNLPTGSSSRGFVFTTANANTILTCSIPGTKNFIVSPASLPLVVGAPGTVTVTYTGSTVGTFNGTLNCSTTGNAQTFTYPISVVVGPAPVAPTLAYTPTTAAGVVLPAGNAGVATSTIAIASSGAVGTGNTVVSGCAITGAGAASFAAPTTNPANGTFNTATVAGAINLSCTRGNAVTLAALACTETSTPGAVATRTWPLTCPAFPTVTPAPGSASGTASPLPGYALPNTSSFRDFVFTTAGADTTLACSIDGSANFVVSPASLPLVVGVSGTVRVTYTGSTAGTFNGTLNCTAAGVGGQTLSYPIRVTVDPVVIPVPTLSFMGSLMLLAGFLGLGMFMANRRA